ncbi:hypothetical protein FKP32DRAFT_1631567 [Trametes sanguinea]|nr:hypothetical protein FKP32DRAFT_1631567 [Trametes sanguinea]
MSSVPSVVDQFPPELLAVICAHVYASGLPPHTSSLDPLLCADQPGIPTGLPSSFPPAYSSEAVVRRTLANLCLVNKAWYEAAKPWLWRKIEIRLPRSWLAIVDEVAGGEDEDANEEQAALMVDQTLRNAETAALAAQTLIGECSDDGAALELHDKVLARLTGPDISIPPELLTPPASRDPSPRRLRTKSKSPARWKLMRSISVAVQDVMERAHPGIYGKSLRPSAELPNLLVFGATEYMDGALTFPVLKELLLRGSASRGRGRPSRGRDVVIPDPNDPEQEDLARRRECKDLEAVDLTGCVSGVFVSALSQFVNTFLLDHSESSDGSDSEDERERRRPRSRNRNMVQEEPLTFPGMRRLGLRGVKSLQPHILEPLVLAFPNLTHLDLSCTRITPDGLAALGASPTPRLRSLGLSHIRTLELGAVAEFLRTKAPHVEVLTLVTSTPELGVASTRQATIALHTQLIRPLCTPPFSFSLSTTSKPKTEDPPTRLRVVELAPTLLTTLGAGAGTWRIVRSKGGRGWYVDAASGWVAQVSSDPAEEGKGSVLRRDLEPNHPWRLELESLADANGNVSSGVGWHARKMEILHGDGLLGREAGLYGAVAFAYQG